MHDPIEVMRRGDGGGHVWEGIERRLKVVPEPHGVQRLAGLLERLGLDGTVFEAALRVPGPAPVLALAALLVLMGSAKLTELMPRAVVAWLLAPALGVLAGAVGFRREFDPANELTRTSTSARALLFARQTVVYAILSLVALGLPWLPPQVLTLWLLPTLCLNALALALSLQFGGMFGLSVGFGLWFWLALLHLPSEHQKFVPAFPGPGWQVTASVLALAWAFWKAEQHARRG